MKRILLAGLALLSATPLYAAPADTSAIRAVIERFRTAIVAKDRSALEAFPANDHITFLSVLDETTLARIRRKRPDAKRVTVGSYADFVRDVTTDPDRQEEVFSNIVVHSDGSVADVWFDYDFRENGVVTNAGHESWGLVHTDGGWKIGSIVYSVTVPVPDPKAITASPAAPPAALRPLP